MFPQIGPSKPTRLPTRPARRPANPTHTRPPITPAPLPSPGHTPPLYRPALSPGTKFLDSVDLEMIENVPVLSRWVGRSGRAHWFLSRQGGRLACAGVGVEGWGGAAGKGGGGDTWRNQDINTHLQVPAVKAQRCKPGADVALYLQGQQLIESRRGVGWRAGEEGGPGPPYHLWK